MSDVKAQMKSKAQKSQILNLKFDIHLTFEFWHLEFVIKACLVPCAG
jgi:hypothetical protein